MQPEIALQVLMLLFFEKLHIIAAGFPASLRQYWTMPGNVSEQEANKNKLLPLPGIAPCCCF